MTRRASQVVARANSYNQASFICGRAGAPKICVRRSVRDGAAQNLMGQGYTRGGIAASGELGIDPSTQAMAGALLRVAMIDGWSAVGERPSEVLA